MGLTVGYIGNFRSPWCTEVHLARELRGLGHEVLEFQEPSEPAQGARFLRMVEHQCRTQRPDLVMFTRTWGLPPAATDLWRRLESRGIKTCSYHLDLYVGLKREEGIDNDPFWTTQYVFTPDGDPKSEEFFASKGIAHHWMPPAVVSDECVPGMWRDEYNYDVVFVGSEGYHPEWPWRGQLLNFLRERYGSRFRRFGGDCPEGPTRGADLNDLYATAKVVVGDSLCLPGHTNYFSDRYFETIGRGGFLIAPLAPGIERLLTSFQHFVGYPYPYDLADEFSVRTALEGLGEMVDEWLKMDEPRSVVARAGQAHVARYHTYRNRLSRALAIMGFGGVSVDEPGRLMIIDDPVKGWEDGSYARMVDDYMKASQERTPGDRQVGYTRVAEGDLISQGYTSPPTEWKIVGPVIEKLELGSGYNPTPGFTTLDMNPACNPDIVGPAWPLELPDESVGELRAVDVLEHISYHYSAEVLADWFRVLRPGGKLYVQVPDADQVMRWYAESYDQELVDRVPVNGPVTPLLGVAWRLLGGHDDGVYVKGSDDWRLNAHYSLWSEESLNDALVAAGFVVDDMRVNGHPNLLTWCSKP